MEINLECRILIGYIIFQLIVWYIAIVLDLGERTRNGRQFDYSVIVALGVLGLPIINILFIIWFTMTEETYQARKDFKLGFEIHKDIYHYITLALPVIALLTLFFVEI